MTSENNNNKKPISFEFRQIEKTSTGKNSEYWKKWENPVDFDPHFEGMREYIKEILKKEEWSDHPTNDKIIIAFASFDTLSKPEVYETLLDEQYNLRRVTNSRDRRLPKGEQYTLYPIIVIGPDDLMEVGGEIEKYSALFQDGDKTISGILGQMLRQMDPRFRFFDSSIWHRYVSVFPPETFKERLCEVLKTISTCYQQELYKTYVAQEYLEYYCRVLRESYFADHESGHAKRVTPDRFHSENKMKKLAEKTREELEGYTWGCLLIDDFFKKPLRLDNKGSDASINKTELIFSLLNSHTKSSLSTPKPALVEILNSKERDISPPQTWVDFGLELIEKYQKADIIILDYLLGSDNLNVQYGHEFIQKIWEDKGENLALYKPFEKFWIFPISVFSDSFNNHLRLSGIDRVNDKIEMADGVDPVNTPEMFRYLFYKFLFAQKMTVGVNIEKLMEKISTRLEKDSIKGILADEYAEITFFISKLSRLERVAAHKPNGNFRPDGITYSYFSTSNYKDIDPHKVLKDLCIHLQNLAYLVAFGSGLEWVKMWKSYVFIQNIIENLNFDDKKLKKDLSKSKDVLDKIKKYIIGLKSQYG